MPSLSLPFLLRGTGGPATPGDPTTYSYRLVLANLGTSGLGTPILSDVLGTVGMMEGTSLSWTDELNGPGSLEFTLPIDHADVTRANFAEGQREVHLYRDDGTGEVLVWGGRLWASDTQGWTVRFLAQGWMRTLERREIRDDLAYTTAQGGPYDQNAIVEALLDYTQTQANGDLGITFAADAASGVTREIVVCAEELRSVFDVIDSMVEAHDDGFDWEITPDKRLLIYAGRKGQFAGALDTTTNIADFSYQRDATSVANDVAGLSSSTEDCPTPDMYVATDSGSQSDFGLLQDHIDPRDPEDSALVASQTDEELDAYKDSRVQPTVTLMPLLGEPDLTDFAVGDTVSLTSSRGAAGGFGYFSQTFRVISRTVTVPAAAVVVESVALTLDQVIA